MLRSTRFRRLRAAAFVGLLGAGLLAGPPAFADAGDRRGVRHHRHHDRDRHHARAHRDAPRHERRVEHRRDRDRHVRHVRRHDHHRHRARRPVVIRVPQHHHHHHHHVARHAVIPARVHGRYWCAPCDRWWHERSHFYLHLGGHHHVPSHRFANVIAHVAFGAVFYGH